MLNYWVPFLRLWNMLSIGSLMFFAAGTLALFSNRKIYLTTNLVASVMKCIQSDRAGGFGPASSHPNNTLLFFKLLEFYSSLEAVA